MEEAGARKTMEQLIKDKDTMRAEIKRLKAENEQHIKLLRGLHRCSSHKPDGSTAWGCPDCVSELRGENKKLREALEVIAKRDMSGPETLQAYRECVESIAAEALKEVK